MSSSTQQIQKFGIKKMTDLNADTPITSEEKEQLLPSYISTRDELNAAEQANIIKALLWAEKRNESFLSQKALVELHRRMFSDVWGWAGKYRKTPRNIGIDAYKIPMEMESLISDTLYWKENHTYSLREIAARFHHKLVYIHPFPNGNGRFSRMATDLILKQEGQMPFKWGDHLEKISQRRRLYIEALREADKHDFSLLFSFLNI